MLINENIGLNATIINSEGGIDRPIMSMNCNLNSNLTTFSINCSIMDKSKVSTNAVEVQAQINEFIGQVRIKMQDLGYSITI